MVEHECNQWIDGCSLESYVRATVSVVSAGICHRNKVQLHCTTSSIWPCHEMVSIQYNRVECRLEEASCSIGQSLKMITKRKNCWTVDLQPLSLNLMFDQKSSKKGRLSRTSPVEAIRTPEVV